MANECNFDMKVVGKHDDIHNFYNALTQNGKYWMGRGAWADIYDEDYDEEDEYGYAKISGYCKWSILSALFDNAVSMRTEPEMWCGVIRGVEFITFKEACEKWNVSMEVYSEEPGCKFQEHYIYIPGEEGIDKEDRVDYQEYWLDDYASKESAEEDLEIEITDEEWKNKTVGRGGFDSWDFEI